MTGGDPIAVWMVRHSIDPFDLLIAVLLATLVAGLFHVLTTEAK